LVYAFPPSQKQLKHEPKSLNAGTTVTMNPNFIMSQTTRTNLNSFILILRLL